MICRVCGAPAREELTWTTVDPGGYQEMVVTRWECEDRTCQAVTTTANPGRYMPQNRRVDIGPDYYDNGGPTQWP